MNFSFHRQWHTLKIKSFRTARSNSWSFQLIANISPDLGNCSRYFLLMLDNCGLGLDNSDNNTYFLIIGNDCGRPNRCSYLCKSLIWQQPLREFLIFVIMHSPVTFSLYGLLSNRPYVNNVKSFLMETNSEKESSVFLLYFSNNAIKIFKFLLTASKNSFTSSVVCIFASSRTSDLNTASVNFTT